MCPRLHEPNQTVLLGAIKSYSKLAAIKPRTLAEVRYAVEHVIRFLGHDDAARIERADLARWRDAMKAEGRSNNTYNNRLSLLGQVLDYGMTEGEIAQNVAAQSLRLRRNKVSSPRPYGDDDAVRILTAARRERRPSLRWGTWVMAFTGARAAEVLQLTGRDICCDTGVWYIAIHEEDDGKSVKNRQRRHVPIHPGLIKEGFLDYARSFVGDQPLFPDKALDPHGQRGGRSWQVLGRWVRQTVGITDPRLAPSHSWRHRMEDELRAVGVEESYRDALLGHARKTTGALYGVRGEALVVLARCLALMPPPRGLTWNDGTNL